MPQTGHVYRMEATASSAPSHSRIDEEVASLDIEYSKSLYTPG